MPGATVSSCIESGARSTLALCVTVARLFAVGSIENQLWKENDCNLQRLKCYCMRDGRSVVVSWVGFGITVDGGNGFKSEGGTVTLFHQMVNERFLSRTPHRVVSSNGEHYLSNQTPAGLAKRTASAHEESYISIRNRHFCLRSSVKSCTGRIGTIRPTRVEALWVAC